MTSRFVGSVSSVAGVKLDHIGQAVENARGSGLPVISEEQFAAIFTDETELKKWGHVNAREAAPESFQAKLNVAWKVIDHDFIYAEPDTVDFVMHNSQPLIITTVIDGTAKEVV